MARIIHPRHSILGACGYFGTPGNGDGIRGSYGPHNEVERRLKHAHRRNRFPACIGTTWRPPLNRMACYNPATYGLE
ncbi:MAG: hypothetical protein ACOZHQ_09550 [Thermodesulfobacteriota bacterium]